MSVEDKSHELLLQSKSDMLDEVNQLLDLMVTEKQSLQQKIVNLEAELETASSGQVTKDHNSAQLIQHNETASQTQKPEEPDFNQLQSAINQEQKSMQHLYQRVQDIEQYCKTERETHQTTLNQSQLHLTQVQNSLKKQCRENKKLQDEVLLSQHKYQQLETSHKNLLNTLEEMKGRYLRTRTSLLAVKGRTALEQKRVLKEEEELVRKQRELDEVVMREKELKIKLQQTVELREDDKTKLNNKIIKKDKEIVQLVKLKNVFTTLGYYDNGQVKQLKIVKESVAEQLVQVEAELQSSRKELNELQQLLTTQQSELDKTKKCLQEERRRTESLLTQSQVTINRLVSQLERERLDYQKEVQALNVAMATQKQEATLQLERLKDVSMRRCTELAQEVWSLKSKQSHDKICY